MPLNKETKPNQTNLLVITLWQVLFALFSVRKKLLVFFFFFFFFFFRSAGAIEYTNCFSAEE